MRIILIIALIIGLIIPFCSEAKYFYYLLPVVAVLSVFIFFKKDPVNLVDLLVIFAATIPFHSFRFGKQGADLTAQFIRLSEIAFVPLFIAWAISRFLDKKRAFVIRKEFIWLGLYLILNLISTKNSMHPMLSIKRIIILSYLFFFVYMAIDILDKKDKLNTLIIAMILISSISAIIAIMQCVYPPFIIFEPKYIGTVLGIKIHRASVGWIDPNYYGMYLGMNTCLTISLLLSNKKDVPKFLKTCFILQIAGIFTTFSRSTVLSLMFSSLYILNYYNRKKIFEIVLSSIIIIAFSILVLRPLIYQRSEFIAKAVFRAPQERELIKRPTYVMGDRIAAYIANWRMFLAHPVIGVGPFMAYYNFPAYQPNDFPGRGLQISPHNQYIQLLSEKGFMGPFIYLGFIFAVFRSMSRALKKTKEKEYKIYLAGFKMAIIFYLIFCLTGETSHEVQFWLTMGASLAVVNLAEKDLSRV